MIRDGTIGKNFFTSVSRSKYLLRYTDYFPRACLFVVGIGLFITLIANHIKPLYLGNA